MIIDSSALLAILFAENDAESISRAIALQAARLLSAGNYLETNIVISSQFEISGIKKLDALIELFNIEIVAVDNKQVRLARDAFLRYGKGRHKAGLNFGDCFAYALAKERGLPLLFKGNDFTRTDIEIVAY